MNAGSSAGRAALIYVAIGALQRSLAILLLPFITRLMSPAEYGLITIAVTTTSLIGTLFASAVEAVLYRALAAQGARGGQIMRWSRTYLVVLLPIACCAAGGGLIVAFPSNMVAYVWALEIAAAGLVGALSSYALPLMRGRNRLAAFATLALAWMISSATLKIVLLLSGLPSALGWAVGDFIGGLVAWSSALIFARPNTLTIGKPTDANIELPTTIVGLIRASLPLVPHRASFWALSTLSRPLLGLFVSNAGVGIFALAVNIGSIGVMLLGELNRSFLIEYSRESLPAPTRKTQGLARMQLLIAISGPAIVAAGAVAIGPLLVTEQYYPSMALSAPIMLGCVFYGLFVVPTNYLVQTAGKYKWGSIGSFTGAVVIFVGTVIGGLIGNLWIVAAATTLGYAAMAAAGFAALRFAGVQVDWRKLRLPAKALSIAALCFCMGAILLLLYPAGNYFGWIVVAVAFIVTALSWRKLSR